MLMYPRPRVTRDAGVLNPAEITKQQVLQAAPPQQTQQNQTGQPPPQQQRGNSFRSAAAAPEPAANASPAFAEVSQALQRVRATLLPTMLSLNYFDLGNEDAELIAQVLNERNTGLTYISLACNNIKSQGLVSLANALKENRTLQVLHLQNNQIDDAGMLALGTTLKSNTSLRELWLSDNRITTKGLANLAEALVTNKSLTNIRLDKNPIDNEGAKILAAVIKMRNSTVQQLDLRFTDVGDSQVLTVIQQVTSTNFARPRMVAFLSGARARPNAAPIRTPLANFLRNPLFDRSVVRMVFQFAGFKPPT